MNHIHGYPHSKEAEFYKLLLNYDESLERDLADCGAIWYESGTQNLMVGDYRMSDRIASMVVSKYYGFIKRLVDNDKIDTKKVAERRKEDGWSIINYNHSEEQMCKEVMDEYWINNTLMTLSISDNPIDDLISYLR